MSNLMEIRSPIVELPTVAGWGRPVNEMSLRIGAGQCVGLVGESGSGKMMLSQALMELLPSGARVNGEVLLRRGEEGRAKSKLLPTKLLLERPEGEYTRELLAAVPAIPRPGQV